MYYYKKNYKKTIKTIKRLTERTEILQRDHA